MYKLKICLPLFSLILLPAMIFAQKEGGRIEDEPFERLNYGLKLGLGFSTMFGGELQNPRPAHGFVAGFYWHTKPEKNKLGFQSELLFRLRGSNFANQKHGNTAYTRIDLMTIDVPLLLSLRLSAPAAEKYKSLLFGLNTSYIFKSVVYEGEDKTPTQWKNWNNIWKNLPFRPIEFAGVLAYQQRGQIVGYQIALKMGINNLNNNFVIPNLLPATGTGKPIRTGSIEFSLLF